MLLPEAEARAMIAAAAAAGDLVDPRTVQIDGFVMVSIRAFERLSKNPPTDCGGEDGKAGAGSAAPAPAGYSPIR